LTGAFGPAGQMINDKRLPLAAKDGKNRFKAALEVRLGQLDLRILALTK
jgi:hypothetical protein